ncbi:hypothetical protein B0H14DRAFT_2645305 [Mycena olivaceomarginata]|nr:hypothetical protein B0H14DRAFT_2645305 [Mycena olivaceomarginata]
MTVLKVCSAFISAAASLAILLDLFPHHARCRFEGVTPAHSDDLFLSIRQIFDIQENDAESCRVVAFPAAALPFSSPLCLSYPLPHQHVELHSLLKFHTAEHFDDVGSPTNVCTPPLRALEYIQHQRTAYVPQAIFTHAHKGGYVRTSMPPIAPTVWLYASDLCGDV